MKSRLLSLLIMILLPLWVVAQTQQGYVKTKGRMVNGKHIPGQGLKGATVSIKGRTTVLVNSDDGAFSFPVTEAQFRVDSVRKKGYQLIDMDAISKTYNPSANPIYLVMETPEQQLQDKLDTERKIRRNMQRKLEEREDEIESLYAQQKMDREEYQQALNKLYADQQNNEMLISEMAKAYSRIDYDQIDELNQRISDAILNGHLNEADSLLHSKGSMTSRIAEIKAEQQTEALAETQLNQAKAGTQRKLSDAADDCQKYFDRFKMDMEFDSAAYYLELRANLDTTHPEWQDEASRFYNMLNQNGKAELYGKRTVALYRQLAKTDFDTYALLLAHALGHLGNLYMDTQRLAESKPLLDEAISLCKRHAKRNLHSVENDFTALPILNNLVNLSLKTKDYDNLEQLFEDFNDIFQRLNMGSISDYVDYNFMTIVVTLEALGRCHQDIGQIEVAEKTFDTVIYICKRITAIDSSYVFYYAGALESKAILYATTGRQRQAAPLLEEAVGILQCLYESNPRFHERYYTESLWNLARLYREMGKNEKAKKLFEKVLPLMKRQAVANKTYEIPLVDVQISLGFYLAIDMRTEEALNLMEEAFATLQRLQAEGSPHPEEYLTALNLLHLLYGSTKDYANAYRTGAELLAILEQQYQANPSMTNQFVATVADMSFFAIFQKNYEEAEQFARQTLAIDPSKSQVYTNLAAALLFQGRFDKAETLYRQYKDELKDSFLQDFNDFEAADVIPEERKADVERIRKMLNE